MEGDSGSYECVAVNAVGEARCTATVTVEEKDGEEVLGKPSTSAKEQPKVIEKLKDVTVREGQSAVFKCRISGSEGNFFLY